MKIWLDDIVKQAKNYDIQFKTLVKETTSSVVKEIIKSAEEEKIDLIVVGSTGKSKLDRMLVGSVAQGVVTNPKCSVLLVR